MTGNDRHPGDGAHGRGERGHGDAVGGPGGAGDRVEVDQLLDELAVLEDQVESAAAQNRVRKTMRMAHRLDSRGPFGRVIRGFDRSDAAEALVGSVVFGIPMAIEGGTLEAGAYLADHPLFLLATVVSAVALLIGLLYVADIQEVKIVDPYLGIVPRRLFWVTVISGGTAMAMMTVWGRVDWAAPWLALNQVAVAFAGMAIGAGLGDILPGS